MSNASPSGRDGEAGEYRRNSSTLGVYAAVSRVAWHQELPARERHELFARRRPTAYILPPIYALLARTCLTPPDDADLHDDNDTVRRALWR